MDPVRGDSAWCFFSFLHIPDSFSKRVPGNFQLSIVPVFCTEPGAGTCLTVDTPVLWQMVAGTILKITEGYLDAQVSALLHIICALHEHGNQSGADLHPVDPDLIPVNDKMIVEIRKTDIGKIAVLKYSLRNFFQGFKLNEPALLQVKVNLSPGAVGNQLQFLGCFSLQGNIGA